MFILGKKVTAAIFDLDGTLLDSTGIWKQIDIDFFGRRNMEVPEDYSLKVAHMGLTETAKFTKQEYGIKESIEDIVKEWDDDSRYYYENVISFKEHALELLNYLKEKGVKLAVATANSKELYMPCLKRLGILDYFEFIGDVKLVGASKDNPKLFDYIVEKLNVNKNETLVFDDNSIVIKNAKENGYIPIGVYDIHSDKYTKEKITYSDMFLYNFSEILEVLRKGN